MKLNNFLAFLVTLIFWLSCLILLEYSMSSEESPTIAKGNSDVEEPNFMTSFQFAALTEHFQAILDGINGDEGMKEIQLEFSNLLDTFKSCYAMSEKKTFKIRELLATNALEYPKVKSMASQQEEYFNDLKGTIHVLQKDLQKATEEQRRKLLKEVEDLRNTVKKENKSTQVCDEFLVFPSKEVKGTRFEPKAEKMNEKTEWFSKKLEPKSGKEVTDIKALKNDLAILATDLSFTRKSLAELKKEVRCRDVLIKEYSKDLTDSDLMIAEMRKKITEMRVPLEASLKKCKSELEKEKQKFQNISKHLQAEVNLNIKLSKDVESKGHTIDALKDQIKELSLEKESAERKAKTFEEHLAQSQLSIEALEQEVQILKEGVKNFEKEIPIIAVDHDVLEKDKMEINAQERIVENLKIQIASRDRKIHQVVEELRETAGLLQSARKHFTTINKEKVAFESELQDAKKKLKDKISEVKQLKDRSNEDRKENEELKKDLYSWIKKYQQVVEKKNKFHSLYNLVKRQSSQQENENVILGKRQQYLVKILKDKDKEIEKLISWKRYVI